MVDITIYIDVLIFSNILINYFILSLVEKFFHTKTSQARIIISSVLGSLFSLTVFLPDINAVVSFLIKLSCALVMTIVAFKYSDVISYIKHISATFIFTTIFSGLMILIYQLVKPKNMIIVNDVVYFQIKPLWIIISSVIIYTIIICIQRLLNRDVYETLVDLNFTIDNNEYSCTGKIDTGCTVVEPFSGNPVIIVEESILNNLKPKNIRIIPYKTLSSEQIIYAVKADKVAINKKDINKNIYIGMYKGIISPDIKAIINYEILR